MKLTKQHETSPKSFTWFLKFRTSLENVCLEINSSPNQMYIESKRKKEKKKEK